MADIWSEKLPCSNGRDVECNVLKVYVFYDIGGYSWATGGATVYDFKGVPHQSWNGELRAEKMTLEECINKVFYVPGNNTYFTGQRNMKQFSECNYYYDITELSLEDIRDLVAKGYAFIPFSSEVDKDDVLSYIKIGLKPLFMRCRDYNAMKKAYKEIA